MAEPDQPKAEYNLMVLQGELERPLKPTTRQQWLEIVFYIFLFMFVFVGFEQFVDLDGYYFGNGSLGGTAITIASLAISIVFTAGIRLFVQSRRQKNYVGCLSSRIVDGAVYDKKVR